MKTLLYQSLPVLAVTIIEEEIVRQGNATLSSGTIVPLGVCAVLKQGHMNRSIL